MYLFKSINIHLCVKKEHKHPFISQCPFSFFGFSPPVHSSSSCFNQSLTYFHYYLIQAVAEKQLQIQALMAEGKKLSDQQFKSSNINKKLQQKAKVLLLTISQG